MNSTRTERECFTIVILMCNVITVLGFSDFFRVGRIGSVCTQIKYFQTYQAQFLCCCRGARRIFFEVLSQVACCNISSRARRTKRWGQILGYALAIRNSRHGAQEKHQAALGVYQPKCLLMSLIRRLLLYRFLPLERYPIQPLYNPRLYLDH